MVPNFPQHFRRVALLHVRRFLGGAADKRQHHRARMAVRDVLRLHHDPGGRAHIRADDIHVHFAEHRRHFQAGRLRAGLGEPARADEGLHRAGLGFFYSTR